MKIIFVRTKPTKEVLRRIYDVMNKNVKNPKCFYTTEDVKKLKQDETNIWL